jgi:hypothetical protein
VWNNIKLNGVVGGRYKWDRNTQDENQTKYGAIHPEIQNFADWLKLE